MGADQLGDIRISESIFFTVIQDLFCKILLGQDSDFPADAAYVFQLFEEEPVNFCHVIYFIDAVSAVQCFGNYKYPFVVGIFQGIPDVPAAPGGDFLHAQMIVQPDIQGIDRLQQGFLKSPTDGHDFSGGFHLGSQGAVGGDEFIKRPSWHLGYHIIQCRFKAGTCVSGHGIFNFVQIQPHGDFTGYPRDGVTGGFGCQCAGPAYPGIYFDNHIFVAEGIQCKLDVAAAPDPEGAYDPDGSGTQHLIFPVGKGLTGSRYNTVPGMDAHRIKIFHIAHNNTVVRIVPDHFILDFLPARNALLQQDLMNHAVLQAFCHNGSAFLHIMGDAASGATQGIGWPDDDGKS